MIPAVELSPLFMTKIGFGLVAILFNAICVWLVIKRKRIVAERRFDDFDAVDHKQHVYGAVVLVSFLIALGVGGYYFIAG